MPYQATNYPVQAAVADAALVARDLIAQGLSSDEACEHAALQFDTHPEDVASLLRTWRELPVEYDEPRAATW